MPTGLSPAQVQMIMALRRPGMVAQDTGPMPEAGSALSRLIDALRRRLGGGGVDQQAEAARAGAEEVSQALPEAVMPRQAILRKRQQMEQMDRMMRDE